MLILETESVNFCWLTDISLIFMGEKWSQVVYIVSFHFIEQKLFI